MQLREWMGLCLVAVCFGCATETETTLPETTDEASEELVIDVEAELQDAFNNAACYCENYLIKPTETTTNPDPTKEWASGVSADACSGDPRLDRYVDDMHAKGQAELPARTGLEVRKAGACMNLVSAPTVLMNRTATPDEYKTNGCWDPVAQYDPYNSTPSAGFCRADFDYCIAQQLRLKADSLARPPATPEVRARMLAEARNRFLRAGTQHANTLARVDSQSDATSCAWPDTCHEFDKIQNESVTHTNQIIATCETKCHPKNPDYCWEVCSASPSPLQASGWCTSLRNTRYNQLLAQTPDAYDSQVTVSRTLSSTTTEYRCKLDASYPVMRSNTQTREKTRVLAGYGAVVTARIADSIAQAGDLADVEMSQYMALSDAESVTNSGYIESVWGPSGSRTRALQVAFGDRNPRPAFPQQRARRVQRDDGPRRALALLSEHHIPLPYSRCPGSEGWETLDTAGIDAWATSAFQSLAQAVAAALGQDASQGSLLLLENHAVSASDVRKAYDLARDQLELLDVDYSFVVPEDAPPGSCARAYLVETGPTTRQRDVILSAQALVDGNSNAASCDASYASTEFFRSAGAVGGLAHLRERVATLANQSKLQSWAQEASVVSAKSVSTLLLGKTWTSYSLCNLPPYCASGTWSILGDVSDLQGDEQIRIARSSGEAYCLTHGHLPGQPAGTACPATTAYPLAPITYPGVQGRFFSTPDFLNQASGSQFYLFLERCPAGQPCVRRLIDTLYPADTGPYPTFSASTTHSFGGTLLSSAARVMARSFTNPALPLFNSLGIENQFVPPLLNPLDSQGNTAQESFVHLLDEARSKAQQASLLLGEARDLEISYLRDLTNVNLALDGAALAEEAVVTGVCGSNEVCDTARAPAVGLADLGIFVAPGPEPVGYPSTLSCTQFVLAAPPFSVEGQSDKKAYAEGYLSAQLRCTRWMVLELASRIRFDRLPQAVVDAMPPPGWPNPPANVDPFPNVGGKVKATYLELYRELTELAIALRQFDTQYQLADNALQQAILQIDEAEPSIWDKVSCVAGKVAKVTAAIAGATAAIVAAAPAAGVAATVAITSSIASQATAVLTTVEVATAISSCWNENGASIQARAAWGGVLSASEGMKGFYDATIATFGKVLAADNELADAENAIRLADEKRALEERVALNSFSMDASWRAMQGFRVERARKALADAQRLGFAARRAVEFRTASDLGWITNTGFVGGAPATWAGDVFVVDQAYVGGGGTVSAAAERIVDFADALEAFVDHYAISHAFALDQDRAIVNLRELLGGRPLPESLLFKCADVPELLPGGHLPGTPQPDAPCDGLGEVESVTVQFAIPTVPSGYAASRLALGNHNYRIRSVGVNLYAFGLFDCSLAASPFECFLETNVRYDLRQDGVVGLDNLDGEQRYYSINDGVINGARALADESVLPNDSAIAPYEKNVLLGRPLGGMYTLTFHSRPEILWQNLENIQLHVRYEYWTAQN